MISDCATTVDLQRDELRLSVVALSRDKTLGGVLQRGGRGQIGTGDRLSPFRGLGVQLLVKLGLEARRGSAVEREERGADRDRGDDRDRCRQLGAQAGVQDMSTQPGTAAGNRRYACFRSGRRCRHR